MLIARLIAETQASETRLDALAAALAGAGMLGTQIDIKERGAGRPEAVARGK